MTVLSFLVVYYHIFFLCAVVAMSIDYMFEFEVFDDIREVMDKPIGSFYIFVEICIIAAFIFAYVTNSTAIMTTLFAITLLLIACVVLFLVIYMAHRLLNEPW